VRHRRVLVTGAASGLGAALTSAFRARGDEVLATDLESSLEGRFRRRERSERLDGPGVPCLALDVRSDADWAAARDWVVEHWGGLDVLVNNAGVAGGGRIDICTLEEWQRLTDVNLFGLVRGTRAFAPLLKEQGSGTVVNVASLAGLVHPPGMGSYNAVKAAVVALSETLGHELAPYGVGCAVVCPSYFRTNLMDSLDGADTDVAEKVAAMVDRSPLTADQIAEAVLAGLDEGLELIVPDEPARAAYDLKRGDRAAYDAEMRRTARRLKERSERE
jgi:NAD(P)-dependent dehydrogenase (short-subunit alcohol dehydrogenase family)